MAYILYGLWSSTRYMTNKQSVQESFAATFPNFVSFLLIPAATHDIK